MREDEQVNRLISRPDVAPVRELPVRTGAPHAAGARERTQARRTRPHAARRIAARFLAAAACCSAAAGGSGARAMAIRYDPQTPSHPRTGADALARCDAAVRDAPRTLASYECFASVFEAGGDRAVAQARLEGLLTVDPRNHYARLGLARLLDRVDGPRAVDLTREAVDGFVGQRDRRGEAQARLRRFTQLGARMKLDEAEAEAGLALEAAEASGDRTLQLTIRILQGGRIALNRNDVARAWVLLRGAELDPAFADLHPGTRALCFVLLHMTANRLDLPQISERYSERFAEIVDEHGLEDKRTEAHVHRAILAQNAFHRGELSREDALAVIRNALRVALAARDPVQEFELRGILSRVADMPEAEEQWAEMRRGAARRPGSGYLSAFAARQQALRLIEADPPRFAEAIAPLEETITGMMAMGMLFYAAEAAPMLVDAHLHGDAEGGVATALSALKIIEHFRELQSGDELSVQAFSQFASAYYGIVDHLLDRSRGGDGDFDLAFRVGERMRARSLITFLKRPAAGAGASPAAERRRAVLKEIARTQLEAIRSEAPSAEREKARLELERLELEEEGLRGDLAATDASLRVPQNTDLPGTADVRAALADDEALLTFLVPSDPLRRAWLQVIHRNGSYALVLPPGGTVDNQARFWLGALQRRDGSGDPGAVRLYRELLAEGLEGLPPSVTRLIVIPDGPVHRLPLDALRAAPDAPLLAERFTISQAPSASVWLHLRGTAGKTPSRAPKRVLVLADPEPPGAASWPATWRSALPDVAGAGRLPHARSEGEDALRALGGNGEMRTGRDASEPFLKGTDLGGFSVVHIAAHAITDQANPARSAILLSPGEIGDDGLLQAREITDLRFGGGLVILSACRSAGGPVFRGEGVMSLARSLFQARAAAVVGGLWPLEDSETARFMSAFYREIGRGRPVSDALATAKRRMIKDGAPPASWAGIVVLGEGQLRPWAGKGGAAGFSVGLAIATAGILAAAGALVAVLWLLSRRRSA